MSALSSGKLEKYEYLTVEDLRYKPRVFERAKFEYFPLRKVFDIGFDKNGQNRKTIEKIKEYWRQE